MLGRRLIGIYRVIDPDGLLDGVKQGWIILNDEHRDICDTVISHDDDLVVSDHMMSDAIIHENGYSYEIEVDGDEHTRYEDREFDIEVKILPQNAFKYMKLKLDSWRELAYLSDKYEMTELYNLCLKRINQMTEEDESL